MARNTGAAFFVAINSGFRGWLGIRVFPNFGILAVLAYPTFMMMQEPEDKPNNDMTESETPTSLEQALKQDRLGGWPSIIGVGGTVAFFLNMVFRGWDAYIHIGASSLYLWELCLYCLVIAIAFLPASIQDAQCLAAGEPRPSIRSFSKGIIIRLLVSILAIIIIHQVV